MLNVLLAKKRVTSQETVLTALKDYISTEEDVIFVIRSFTFKKIVLKTQKNKSGIKKKQAKWKITKNFDFILYNEANFFTSQIRPQIKNSQNI